LKNIEGTVILFGQVGRIIEGKRDDLLVFRTGDAGRSWDESRTSLPRDWPEVREISFVDQDHGWIAVGHKQDEEIRLLGTTDGGRTWRLGP
jgi:photosystem II stability/assembly factor-like uncharacterized protein